MDAALKIFIELTENFVKFSFKNVIKNCLLRRQIDNKKTDKQTKSVQNLKLLVSVDEI